VKQSGCFEVLASMSSTLHIAEDCRAALGSATAGNDGGSPAASRGGGGSSGSGLGVGGRSNTSGVKSGAAFHVLQQGSKRRPTKCVKK